MSEPKKIRSLMNRKKIENAEEELTPEAKEQLIRAFKATRTLDVYGGDLTQYLAVIATSLENVNAQIKEYKAKIAKFKSDVDNL